MFASPEPEESTSEAIHLEKSTALQKTDNHPLKSQLLWKRQVKGQCDFSDLTILEKGTEPRARWQCSAPAVRTWTHVLLSEATSHSAGETNLQIFPFSQRTPSPQFLMCHNIFLLLFSVFSLKASKAPPESESELWRLPLWAEALLKSALIESQGRPPGQGNLASQSCCCFVLCALLLRLSSSLRVCLHHWERPAEHLFIENSASLGVVVHLVLDTSSPVYNCVLGHIP